MTLKRNRLILWTGQRHSGKTTRAAELAQLARDEGFDVAGLLAISVYRDGRLIGFDAFDIRSKIRAPLARRKAGGPKFGPFSFITEGQKLGAAALSPAATKSAKLIIVDEFGPLELSQQGWRESVDSLLTSSDAVILLVVRQDLAKAVMQLYRDIHSIELNAGKPDSVEQAVTFLKCGSVKTLGFGDV
jgi:nucleoside-triphosphatase THEP1